MGYTVDHYMIVTGGEKITKAHTKAEKLFPAGTVSPILSHPVNGGNTFFVCPNGSKRGWIDATQGDKARDLFIEWLETKRNDWLSWVEIAKPEDGTYSVARERTDD